MQLISVLWICTGKDAKMVEVCSTSQDIFFGMKRKVNALLIYFLVDPMDRHAITTMNCRLYFSRCRDETFDFLEVIYADESAHVGGFILRISHLNSSTKRKKR